MPAEGHVPVDEPPGALMAQRLNLALHQVEQLSAYAERLEEQLTPRNKLEELPKTGQDILVWVRNRWQAHTHCPGFTIPGTEWLPSPPKEGWCPRVRATNVE